MLLVIACPCALVISTPVSVVAALAAAARNGVLVKGGAHLEAPAHLNAVALDKTGTLTEGKLAVVHVVGTNSHSNTELLDRAAAMESHSDHPIARAILDHASQQGISIRPAEDFRILPGKGATAKLDGRQYWLGSHRLRGGTTAGNHARPRGVGSPWPYGAHCRGDRQRCSRMRFPCVGRPHSARSRDRPLRISARPEWSMS